MSISVEEIQSDLERLKIALEKMNDGGLTDNSRVHDIRKRYFFKFKSRLKRDKSNWLEKLNEDLKTTKIIDEQDLNEFIPLDTIPVRYEARFSFLYVFLYTLFILLKPLRNEMWKPFTLPFLIVRELCVE